MSNTKKIIQINEERISNKEKRVLHDLDTINLKDNSGKPTISFLYKANGAL